MAVHKKQKATSATKENVAPASKSGKSVPKTTKANATAKEAVKASQVKGKAKGKKGTDDKDTEIARLRAENANLRKASTEQEEPKIPCPPNAGRTLPLRTAMELDDNTALYNAIRHTVLRLADCADLKHDTFWFNQPKEQIVKICQLARKEQPYLRRFAHSWATEAIIKTICKHRRDYSRRPSVKVQGNHAHNRMEDDENVRNRESDKGTQGDMPMDEESKSDNEETGDEGDKESGSESSDESDDESTGEDDESGDEDSDGAE